MKAFVYHGSGRLALEDRPKPKIIANTDAVVKIIKTTICGTDLNIMRGDLPSVLEGRILGHEGVGIVEQIGLAVTNFKVGDHVLISCITSCGKCKNCKSGMYSHCSNGGGWVLGHLIDGTQAEYVRIPFADHSLHAVPLDADEEALVMFSDILPAGLECGVLSGKVKLGDSVAIIGAGPIGLAALITAQFFSPAETFVVDLDPSRLRLAKSLGATKTIDNTDGTAAEQILNLTQGRGVDVAIEAIGRSASFDICQTIVTAGGQIANIGVHGKPIQLNMERLWNHNITLTTRLVDTVSTPVLLRSFLAGKIEAKKFVTHRFALTDILEAYEIFGNAMKEEALKVIIYNI